MISRADYLAMRARLAKADDPPAPVTASDKPETKIQDEIEAECRRRFWIPLRSRVDKPTTLLIGAPDFIILTPGRVLLVEVKTRTGKLRPEQQAFRVWAEQLDHVVHIVRSLDDFIGLCATV